VVEKDGRATVEEVQPGDKVLKVDNLDVTHLGLERVISALRGRPGDVRTLSSR
jgi:C-terminal processing protease CtpA/Prc